MVCVGLSERDLKNFWGARQNFWGEVAPLAPPLICSKNKAYSFAALFFLLKFLLEKSIVPF